MIQKSRLAFLYGGIKPKVMTSKWMDAGMARLNKLYYFHQESDLKISKLAFLYINEPSFYQIRLLVVVVLFFEPGHRSIRPF